MATRIIKYSPNGNIKIKIAPKVPYIDNVRSPAPSKYPKKRVRLAKSRNKSTA